MYEPPVMTAPLDTSTEPSFPEAIPRVERTTPARPRFKTAEKRSTARLVTLGIVAAAALAGAAFVLRPARVTATPIVKGTAVDAVYATGTVEPFDRVVIKARAAGPIDLKVREGAHVHKGDLLATIDAPTLKHELARGRADQWAASHQAGKNAPQLAMLRAQARSLEADLNTVRNERNRVDTLVASGATPRAELDRLSDRAASLEAQLAANAAQRDALGIDLAARALSSTAQVDSLAARLSDTEVRAPMDGVVLSRFVEPGEVAMINAPLFKLGTTDNLILECAIDEADIGRVTVGKKVAVSLYAFPQAVYRGEVFEILPDADRVKKTFLTKVKLADPPPELRSGMTAEANVVLEEKPQVLLMPADALDPGGSVLVLAGGRLSRRAPQIGIHDMLRVEVKGGLAEGDLVVVGGPDARRGLEDGARATATVRAPSVTPDHPSAARAGMSL